MGRVHEVQVVEPGLARVDVKGPVILVTCKIVDLYLSGDDIMAFLPCEKRVCTAIFKRPEMMSWNSCRSNGVSYRVIVSNRQSHVAVRFFEWWNDVEKAGWRRNHTHRNEMTMLQFISHS